MSFTKPVQLTLPNDNALPPGVDLVIMSMNSKKGVWEIDGVGRVSADGQSVVTKPGMGITHFSLVYAAPIGPKVGQIGAQDVPGADTFNGAMSTSVSLPSYKSLGKDIAPSLLYKSSWAKPTTVISNLFDIPKNDVSLDHNTGTLLLNSVHSCMLFFCQDVNVYADASVKGHAWYEPDFITSQFFTAGIVSAVQTFTGVPNRAKVSYATDLIDPSSSDYLASGLYPYLSHWEVHLKHITVGTQTVTVWTDVSAPQTTVTSIDSVQPINQVFPQDVGGPLFVENEIRSPAGRGWRTGGVQKIVNPNSERVMLEESDGSVASFALSNTISTVFNAAGTQAKLDQGVDFSGLPKIRVSLANGIGEYDLSSPSAGLAKPFDLRGFSGTMQDTGYFVFPINYGGDGVDVADCYYRTHPYSIPRNTSALIGLPDGSILGTDTRMSQVFWGTRGGLDQLIAGRQQPAPTWFWDLPAIQWSWPVWGPGFVTSYCQSVLGVDCPVSNYYVKWKYTVADPTPDIGIGACGQPPQSTGVVPDAGFSGDGSADTLLNAPQYITLAPDNNIVVADTGNNRVRKIDLKTHTISTIAGNGRYYGWDIGENLPATQVSLSHPRGVVYDSIGNLYISTEAGMIRKVDTTGRISTLAGAQSGLLQDSAVATKASFRFPYGMVVDNSRGYLYVADTGHHRVVRIEFQTGMATNVAGNGNQADSVDGLAAVTGSLNNPTNVGLDSQGNLLIVDSGNQKIKRVTFQNQANGILAFASTGTMIPGARQNPDGSWVPWLVRNSDGTWTRNYRNGVRDFFDSTGRQVATVDRVGRQTTYFYDANGNLASITDPAQRKTTYSYNGPQLSAITDPAGRTTQFTIDPATNQLKSVLFPDGSTKSFTYDQNGLMTAQTDQRGKTTQYIYNEWNRLQQTISPSAKALALNDSTSQTVGNHFTNGNVGTLQPVGTEAGGAQDLMFDANGNATQVAKDARGYVGGVTDSSGRQVSIVRNLAGQPTKVTRPDNSTITYNYDPVTQDLLSQTDASFNITTSQTFDSYGNLTSKTTGRNLTSTTAYDPNSGLVLSKTDSLGHTTSYTYSGPLTLLTAVRDFRGKITQYNYDNYGNLVSTTDPLGNVTAYTRDAVGRVIASTNANKQTTQMTYDPMNRLVQVTTPMGKITKYGYLPTGQLASITDAAGNVATFDFDDDGKTIEKTDALGLFSTYAYDANGNLIQEVDPNGNVKRYAFDNLNRLTQKSLPDNVITMAYDQRGNITRAANQQSEVDFSYDVLGRLSTAQSFGLGAYSSLPNVVINYGYDADSNRISMSDSLGGNSTYLYDNGDRLTQITNHKGEVYSFDFSQEAAGQLTFHRPGSSTVGQVDDAGRMTSLIHMAGGTQISSFLYQLDNIGNRTQISTPQGIKAISYDSDNQLKTATNPEAGSTSSYQAENFNYDEISNRTSDQDGTYTYDPKKQRLTEDYRYFYYYDNSGNLTKKQAKAGFPMSEVTNYSYSSENQLLGFRVYQQGSTTPSKEVTYVYDATGRRIQKQVIDHTAPADVTKTFTRRFVYDGQDILIELDANNTILSRYTHSSVSTDSVLAADITSAGVTERLALNIGSYFYLKDGLGSALDVIDNAGNKLQHYVYSAFGELLGIKNAVAADITANPVLRTSYAFAGRELDSESGLYYNRARYYDPNIGRFLQKDPQPGKLGLPITVTNAYVYAGNNPFNLSDPNGQSFLGELILGIVIAAAAAFTGGLAAAALFGASSGLLATAGGVAVGAVVGAVTGGLIEGSVNAIQGGSFSEGFWKGAIKGAISGAIAGYNAVGSELGGFDGQMAGDASSNMASNVQDPGDVTSTLSSADQVAEGASQTIEKSGACLLASSLEDVLFWGVFEMIFGTPKMPSTPYYHEQWDLKYKPDNFPERPSNSFPGTYKRKTATC